MRRHPTLLRLDALLTLVLRAIDEAPATIAALNDAAPSVYGSSTAFAAEAETRRPPVSDVAVVESGPMTTTEALALSPARERARHQARRYEQAISAINVELGRMLSIGARVRPVPLPMCSRGAGREGVIEWGDPLCENIAEPDRGGLCSRCAKAEYRWRRDHGMTPRDRDAA